MRIVTPPLNCVFPQKCHIFLLLLPQREMNDTRKYSNTCHDSSKKLIYVTGSQRPSGSSMIGGSPSSQLHFSKSINFTTSRSSVALSFPKYFYLILKPRNLKFQHLIFEHLKSSWNLGHFAFLFPRYRHLTFLWRKVQDEEKLSILVCCIWKPIMQ